MPEGLAELRDDSKVELMEKSFKACTHIKYVQEVGVSQFITSVLGDDI